MSTPAQSDQNEYTGTLISYVVGFVGSIIITLAAYFLVVSNALNTRTTTVIIMVLAIIQCYVQLIFFLHLNKSTGVHWRLATFLFTILIIVVIGGGTLWIMNDLNYRMHATPTDMLKYMEKEQGL